MRTASEAGTEIATGKPVVVVAAILSFLTYFFGHSGIQIR
jgi:hypothetical protein